MPAIEQEGERFAYALKQVERDHIAENAVIQEERARMKTAIEQQNAHQRNADQIRNQDGWHIEHGCYRLLFSKANPLYQYTMQIIKMQFLTKNYPIIARAKCRLRGS